jgi:hypothetical protein
MPSLSTTRIYAPVILGITILLGLFITRPMYETFLSENIQYGSLENKKSEKEKVLADLVKMQKTFSSGSTWTTDLVEKVNKLWKKWDTSEVMSVVMLNQFTMSNAITTPPISIGSISVDRWTKLPSWLSLWSVSFNVTAASLDDMIDFISYLTQSASYVFTIDSISLPIDTVEETGMSETWLSLSLSLGIYYYE